MENVNTEEGRRLMMEEGNRWIVDKETNGKTKGGWQPVGVI